MMWMMIVAGILYGEPVHVERAFRYQHECHQALTRFRRETIINVVGGYCSFREEEIPK